MADETLADWGEFRILEEIVLPALQGAAPLRPLGDDCAFVKVRDDLVLAVTSDAAPRPLVWQLGCRTFSIWGWYAVLVNASDLAAAAARPLAITTSVEAPPDMKVDDLRSFFAGVAAACEAFGLKNAGGNLRSAPRFECHGTAIGVASPPMVTRDGCRPGDYLLAIGGCGRFISAYLRARQLGGVAKLPAVDQEILLRPSPKTREMQILHEHKLIRAATDNSDGILGSLWNIAERSGCGIEVFMDEARVPPAMRALAAAEHLDPWNLMFFWGDWQVVVAVAKDDLGALQALADRNQIDHFLLGRAVPGAPALLAEVAGGRRPLSLVRNENFARDSFNANIDQHVDFMLRAPLLT